MSCTYIAPIAGSLLRWAGLLFVVFAVVGGIVGMHGINGASTASIVTGGSGHTAIAVDGMAIQATPHLPRRRWSVPHLSTRPHLGCKGPPRSRLLAC
ncbi:hypothetical protein NHF46_00600 [Arthrobacter alpinus]|nr:hypothetical protein [Arthrobacter alpinus]